MYLARICTYIATKIVVKLGMTATPKHQGTLSISTNKGAILVFLPSQSISTLTKYIKKAILFIIPNTNYN
jgi:hypothetical protein